MTLSKSHILRGKLYTGDGSRAGLYMLFNRDYKAEQKVTVYVGKVTVYVGEKNYSDPEKPCKYNPRALSRFSIRALID